MEPASLALAIGAVIFGVLSIVNLMTPYLGMIFGLLAPVCALVGGVLGLLAWSKADDEDRPTMPSIAGMSINAVLLIPAIAVGLFGGTCNAAITMASSKGVHVQDIQESIEEAKAKQAEETETPSADEPPADESSTDEAQTGEEKQGKPEPKDNFDDLDEDELAIDDNIKLPPPPLPAQGR